MSRKMRRRVNLILTYTSLVLIVIVSLFPLFWLFLTSIKPRALTFAIPPVWIFSPTLENYEAVFINGPFLQYVLNSVVVTLASMGIAVVTGSLAAFAFARFDFPGKNIFQLGVLIPQTIPPITIIIPLFIVFRTLDIIDTRPALIFTYLSFTIPLSVWMMVGFIRDVPTELEDAALIDGCTRWQAFWKVVIPLVAPGIAATAILCSIYTWNEFLYAVILTGRNARTVPVAITGFITNRDILWGRIAASGTVVLLPVLVFALFVQRYLVRGLTSGATKG